MSVTERGNPAPFAHWRGSIGCLLLHGFPGSPAEMRPLGEYLAERNITVWAPLLAGLGTIPEDLFGVQWRDWIAGAEAGLLHLFRRCPTIFAVGLSMGGALSFYLAAHFRMAGVVALAPAIQPRDRRFRWVHWLAPFFKWVESDQGRDDLADPQVRALTWHYHRYPVRAVAQVANLIRATRRVLSRIETPALIVQSTRDGQLEPAGARWAYERISSEDKTLVWLERSGHNIAVDVQRREVFEQVYGFVTRVAGVIPADR